MFYFIAYYFCQLHGIGSLLLGYRYGYGRIIVGHSVLFVFRCGAIAERNILLRHFGTVFYLCYLIKIYRLIIVSPYNKVSHLFHIGEKAAGLYRINHIACYDITTLHLRIIRL